MTRLFDFLEHVPSRRESLPALAAFVVLLFAIGNLPWHLDDYDQAKQAYVAFEITKTGELWFQHTPQGASASKPPLMGWISAALHAMAVPWDLAWRLPSFACAVAMLILLARTGASVLPQAGATLAIAAFGLNLLTPRLATLVRTDMMLGFFIFLIGWQIHGKLRSREPWTARDRWLAFAFMLAALFTKGPVLYAFLLPGLVAYLLLVRGRESRRLAWSGWWTWLIPLLLFLAWGVAGLLTNQEFYDDVVVREFLSRFQEGARDDERPQPLWFYFPHLLHKFAPWSLLLIGFAIAFPAVRRHLRERPAILWLVLWSLGGLLLMTFIPAKRVDRIFPVVPPLCLLVIEWCAILWNDRRARIASGAAIVAGVLFAGIYFIGLVPWSYSQRTPALVEFTQKVRETAAQHGIDDITILRARDEGLLLYLDTLQFTEKGEAFKRWKEGGRGAYLMSYRTAERNFFDEFGAIEPALDSGELIRKNEKGYYLFIRE